jgi:hypothetical protein
MSIVRRLAVLALAMLGTAPATAQRVTFGNGIGYYVFYDGAAYALGWTTRIAEKFDDKQVKLIPKHAEFYAFGLDFSGGTGGMAPVPLPPHLAGIGMMYLKKNGELDGMVRFIPVPGYQEKVYRLTMPTYLIDQSNYDYFALRVSGNDGYLFRFTDDGPKVKELADALTGKLAAGAALEGELALGGFGVRHRSVKVVLKIDGFEANAGTFDATLKLAARDRQIPFKGQRLSEREIVLSRADAPESRKLHLFLRGDGTLTGDGVPILDRDGIVTILELLGLSSSIAININPAASK